MADLVCCRTTPHAQFFRIVFLWSGVVLLCPRSCSCAPALPYRFFFVGKRVLSKGARKRLSFTIGRQHGRPAPNRPELEFAARYAMGSSCVWPLSPIESFFFLRDESGVINSLQDSRASMCFQLSTPVNQLYLVVLLSVVV